MNTLDIIIIVITLLLIIKGFQSGLIKQVINLFGYLIAIFIAFKYSSNLSPYLAESIPLPSFETSTLYIFAENFNLYNMFYNAIAFILIFIGVKLLLSLVTVILDQIASLPGLAMINRSLGAVIGLLEAVIVVVILVNFITILPWGGLSAYIETSVIATYILQVTPMITENIYILWDRTDLGI